MSLTVTEEALVRQLLDQQAAILSLAGNEATITSKLGATKVSLSDLSAATSLSDADLALVRQGLNDKSFAMSVLADYVNGKFPSASETVKGIVELATETEAQSFSSALLAITPSTLNQALKGANQSLAGNGYQRLPGGLIIQWGTFGATVSTVISVQTVTLPMAFPNAIYHVGGAFTRGIGEGFLSYTCENQTTTQFVLWAARGSGGTVTHDFRWVAIGY